MLNLNFNIIGSKSFEQERGTGFNPFPVELLLIGGGGAGGAQTISGAGNTGRGGGAGGFISASWTIPALTTFDVVIGDGGVGNSVSGSSTSGEDSKLVISSTAEVVFNAIGGGRGADGQNPGLTGGSSGGTFGSVPTPITPCVVPTNASLSANTGSVGGFSVAATAAGGGARTSGSIGNNFGLGYPTAQSFITGSIAFANFADGGSGGITGETIVSGVTNSGRGGGGANAVGATPGNGGSGIFAIKYEGLPKATGGTITQADGFTTHLFTSSSQLVVSGRNNSTP